MRCVCHLSCYKKFKKNHRWFSAKNYLKSNNMLIFTSNPPAKTLITCSVGFLTPRSIPLIYVRSNPHLSAKASWDRPDCSLSFLMWAPKRAWMLKVFIMPPKWRLDAYQTTDYESQIPYSVSISWTSPNIRTWRRVTRDVLGIAHVPSPDAHSLRLSTLGCAFSGASACRNAYSFATFFSPLS